MNRKPLSEQGYKEIRALLKRDKKKTGSKNSRVAKITGWSPETVRTVGHFDTYQGFINRKNVEKVGPVEVKYDKPTNTKVSNLEFKEFKKRTSGHLIEYHDSLNSLVKKQTKIDETIKRFSENIDLNERNQRVSNNRSFQAVNDSERAVRLSQISLGIFTLLGIKSLVEWFIGLI